MRYWFYFFIRYSIGYGFFREVISRILAFIRFTLSLATLIFGSILNVKLKPRNFLRQRRSTVDLSRLTFSFNLSSINDVTEFMTRRPALRVFTKILAYSEYLTNLFPLTYISFIISYITIFECSYHTDLT